MSSIIDGKALIDRILKDCGDDIEQLKNEHAEKAAKEFELALRKRLAQYVLALFAEYSVERNGSIVTIRVKTPED